MTDVVMYWKDTPVTGVEEAELPQFTITGYETNDRKESLATGEIGSFSEILDTSFFRHTYLQYSL